MTKRTDSLAAAFEDVCDFHRAGELPCHDVPRVPTREEIDLRIRLIKEEMKKELIPALDQLLDGDPHIGMAAVADAIADSFYVLLGTAAQFGIPIVEVWRRVHESNMAKFVDGIHRRWDGKILKPPGWVAPDVLGAILEARKR